MKVLITGASGMIGTAVREVLPEAAFVSSRNFDLRKTQDAERMYRYYEPDYMIHLAAKVGGVKANTDYIADFYRENILINTNVLEMAKKYKVKKVVSVLSTCVYPDKVTQYPLTEEQLHLGEPHPSNYGYAYAKRMLEVQSRAYRDQYGCDFVCAIPNNLYGENDNFHLQEGHVIPALIRKFHEAKNNSTPVEIWGDGSPLREFTYSLDMAKILVYILGKQDTPPLLNIGNTTESQISDVANIIAEIFDYKGEIVYNTDMPSGQKRKPSSNQKLLQLGWKKESYTSLKDGLKKVCKWFIMNYPNVRGIS